MSACHDFNIGLHVAQVKDIITISEIKEGLKNKYGIDYPPTSVYRALRTGNYENVGRAWIFKGKK